MNQTQWKVTTVVWPTIWAQGVINIWIIPQMELHVMVKVAPETEPLLESQRQHSREWLTGIRNSKKSLLSNSEESMSFFSSIHVISLSFAQLRLFNSLNMLKILRSSDAKSLEPLLTQSLSIRSGHSRTERRVVLVKWPFHFSLIHLMPSADLMEHWLKIQTMRPVVSPWELPISLMEMVFWDTATAMIYQSEETSQRSSDLFQHSNILMNSVRFAQLHGTKVMQPWSQMLIPKRPKTTSKMLTSDHIVNWITDKFTLLYFQAIFNT